MNELILLPIPSSVYVLIGKIFVIFVVLIAVLNLVAICLVIYKRDLFPRFTLFMLTLFYPPAKLLVGYFHTNPIVVDEIGIALTNTVYKGAYGQTPMNRRLLFLPQCLRSLECPAKLSPQAGVICEKCGRCDVAEIKKICDEDGTGICIAPGGEFVKRAVRDKEPLAVLAVACQHDLYETMRHVTSNGVPMVGVALSRCGCVTTGVDWEEVKKMLYLT